MGAGHCVDVCSGKVVRGGGVGLLQDESELVESGDCRGVNCEHTQTLLLNVSQWQEGRREDWVRFFKYQSTVCGQCGCADGLRRSQVVRSVRDLDKYGGIWTRDSNAPEANERREEVRWLRPLRDGISVLPLHQTGRRGRPYVVGESEHTCAVKSGRKMEDQNERM